jgi:hypothetical protein
MKLLLTSIAVLLLATGAQARSFEDYHCGKQIIEYVFEKYFSPNRTDCVGAPCDGKGHYFIFKSDDDRGRRVDHAVRFLQNGTLYYKGRKCREFTEKEYAR